MRRALVTTCLLSLFACSSKDAAERRVAEKAKKAEAAKAEKEKKAAEREAERMGAPKPAEAVKLSAPYDDSGNVGLHADGECPEGFWALFAGEAPGPDKAAKKAAAAKRPELTKGLREKTYLVKFRAPTDVKLSDYDAPNGRFTVEVPGSIDCTDSIGHVAIAWTKAVATTPPASAAQEGSEITQNVWMAPPVTFTLPVATMAAAKEYAEKNKLTLSARVVLKLGKTEVDVKKKKIAKVEAEAAGEKLSIGGGVEDWGAGRLVRAELVGVRLATDKEKTQLAEKKEP